MRGIIALVFVLFSFWSEAQAPCSNPNTIFFEDFEGGNPLPGAVTANIYGGGTYNGAGYIISGNLHGWFNVINGLSNVDVYDRLIPGFCVGLPTEVSFWTRQSFGVTNVTFTVEDNTGAVLATQTLNLTNTYQQIFFNFTATTADLRFIIHCNSTGGNGVDICVEDILMTQCPPAGESVVYSDCNNTGTVNLHSLFSSAIGTTGTWSGPSTLTNGYLGTFDPNVNSNGLYTYSEGTGCTATVSTAEINFPGIIDLGNDTTVCSGSALSLDAGSGFDSYSWSNGATTQSINATAPGTYIVDASVQMGNIVQNGDFEGGTTTTANNFTTDYIPGTGGTWGLLSNGGQYAISTNPSLTHTNFVTCGDHTTGTGNMFIANGSWIAGTVVWRQSVTVTPGTDYLFSFWATNVVNNPNTSDLQLYINNIPIGPVNSTTTSCNWLQISDIWNSGGATTAVLEIINQSTAASGNDFAIDDISFGPICVVSDTIVIDQQTPAQTTSVINPTCQGSTDAEIHVDNVLAVEYSADNGVTWQADSFFLNLSAGTHTICSRTALGCEVCETVTVLDPSPVTVSVSPNVIICQNGSTTLTATGNGGNTFDYHWDFTGDLSANQTVSPAPSTGQSTYTYTVYAENENGCVSAPEVITVTVLAPLTATITPPQSICPGESAGITVSATGGDGGPYTFTWDSGQTTDQITVSPTDTTTYTVLVDDACETTPISISSVVNVAPEPVPSFEIVSPLQCEPGIFEIVNTTDPNTVDEIIWTVNGSEVFVNQETIITQSYDAGSYDLEMTVTSPEGCVGSSLFPNALYVAPAPIANFTFSPNPPTMFNTQVLFNNGSVGASTYEWTFEQGAPSTSNVENPTTIFPDGQVGLYETSLVAISDLGCTDTIILDIQVYPEVILYAPNTFTPDGDEFNQNWHVFIEGVDIYDFELTVFNRWGQIVWQTNDPNAGWDATFNGKTVQDGTYTWFITTRDLLNDKKYEFHGHVNVLH
ncbi:MAG: gliding motility-associated C-terminal domain-containing protein [bacterium]|nr:gliding motility-associated C-terminal domain-containing protein [bacterium]